MSEPSRAAATHALRHRYGLQEETAKLPVSRKPQGDRIDSLHFAMTDSNAFANEQSPYQIITWAMLHTDVITGRACEHRTADSTAQNGTHNEVTLERLQGAVTELLRAISAAVENDRTLFWKSIRRAAAPLDLELRDSATGARAAPSPTDRSLLPGGLTASQVGRIRDFIDGNLEAVIRVENLASLANLSRGHFARAFRQRFDETPHCYVMRRRIEHAQGLMLTSVAPLRQIAVDCGFNDQAHFTKRFRRLVGETPSVWRRARASFA